MRAIKTKGGFGKVPKAFACGILEDRGRILFLVKKDEHGFERVLLPSVMVNSGRSPVAEIQGEFLRQAGIEARVEGVLFEGKYNYGTRRGKSFIPLLAFSMAARRMQAKPSSEFAAFRWISIKEALEQDRKKGIRMQKWASALLRGMMESKK